MPSNSVPHSGEIEGSTGVIRVVVIPDFTPEQTAYLDQRMAAADRPGRQIRVGGRSDRPRPLRGHP